MMKYILGWLCIIQPSLLEIKQSLRKIKFSFITVMYTLDYFASDYCKNTNCLFITLYNIGSCCMLYILVLNSK